MLRPSVVLAFFLSIASILMSGAIYAQSDDAPPSKGRGHRNMPPQGFGGPLQGLDFGMFGLLRREPVQKELNLTKEQAEKIKSLFGGIEAVFRKHMGELRNLPQQEREAKMKELRKEAVVKLEAAQKELPNILKPEQMERLKEIHLQQEGAFALRDPEIRKTLDLTEEQDGKIQKLLSQASEETVKVIKSLRNLPREEIGEKRAEAQKKVQQIREEAAKKVMETLTPEQKEKFEKMKGKPFIKEDRPQKPPKQKRPDRERID